MFQTNLQMEEAYRFSRFDISNPLASCSAHPIVLEDRNWTTCEHYVQVKILRSKSQADYADKLPTAEQVIAYAKSWFRLKIPNHKKILPVLMTRALYTKVQMYDEVKDALLATGDNLIIEGSQYDYFWGVGRDLRGYNHLGKTWMNIRDKIKQDAKAG
ncbi:NADAR family protein [Agaribacter flavus]|uniref:NADAR family protein n=1 Tax=Agaribacter flavus TaxID=1902781 RepID=A0ABV7FLA6_9ALTE